MIGATVNILAQHINRRVAQAVRERGFTDFRASFHPVFQWCRPQGSRLTELAECAGVTKPSMSEIVDILVRLGYFERTPDPSDRRATLIRRTERGWEVNRIARQVVEAVQAEWSQAIGAEAFSQALDGLRRLTRLATERGQDEE
jgi:DNA-binding MarR family transcriptional regulator